MEYDFIFSCYAGSRLQGLATPESDWDLVAVTWETPDRLLTTQNAFESFESSRPEEAKIYGLRFFCKQLLRCNPNFIDLLWCPENKSDVWTPTWEELLKIRESFLSQAARKTFWGYAMSQMKKISQRRDIEITEELSHHEYIKKYGWDTKAGSHVVRLLLQGKSILSGEAPVPVLTGDTLKLVAGIRAGQYKFPQFTKMVDGLMKEITEMPSDLPEKPDTKKIDQFLLEVYKEYLK